MKPKKILPIMAFSVLLPLFFASPAFAENTLPIMSDPLQIIFQDNNSIANVGDIGFFSHHLFPDTQNFTSTNSIIKYPDETGAIKDFSVDDYYAIRGYSYSISNAYNSKEVCGDFATSSTEIKNCMKACQTSYEASCKNIDDPTAKLQCISKLLSKADSCLSAYLSKNPVIKKLIELGDAEAKMIDYNFAMPSQNKDLAVFLKMYYKFLFVVAVCKDDVIAFLNQSNNNNNLDAGIDALSQILPASFQTITELSLADVRYDQKGNINSGQWLEPYPAGFPYLYQNAHAAVAVNFDENNTPMGLVAIGYSDNINSNVPYKIQDFKLITYYQFNHNTKKLELATFVPSFLTNKNCYDKAVAYSGNVINLKDFDCLKESMPTAVAAPSFRLDEKDVIDDLVIADRGKIPGSEDAGYLTYYVGQSYDSSVLGSSPYQYVNYKKLIDSEPYDMITVDKSSVLITTTAGVEKFNYKGGEPELDLVYKNLLTTGARPYQITAVNLGTGCQGFAFTWAKLKQGEKPIFLPFFTLVKGEKAGDNCQYSTSFTFTAGSKRLAGIAFSEEDPSRDLPAGIWVGDQLIYKNKDGKKEARAYFFPIKLKDGQIDSFTPFEMRPVAIGEQLDYLKQTPECELVPDAVIVCGVRKLHVDKFANLGAVLGPPIVFEDFVFTLKAANCPKADIMVEYELPEGWLGPNEIPEHLKGIDNNEDGFDDYCECTRDTDNDGINEMPINNISGIQCDNCTGSASNCKEQGAELPGWPYPKNAGGACYNPDQADDNPVTPQGKICEPEISPLPSPTLPPLLPPTSPPSSLPPSSLSPFSSSLPPSSSPSKTISNSCKNYLNALGKINPALADKVVPEAWLGTDKDGNNDNIPDYCQCTKDDDFDDIGDFPYSSQIINYKLIKCDNCPKLSTTCTGPEGNDPAKDKCYNPSQQDTNNSGFGDICEPEISPLPSPTLPPLLPPTSPPSSLPPSSLSPFSSPPSSSSLPPSSSPQSSSPPLPPTQKCVVNYICGMSGNWFEKDVSFGEQISDQPEGCYENDKDCDGLVDWYAYECMGKTNYAKACDNCPPPPLPGQSYTCTGSGPPNWPVSLSLDIQKCYNPDQKDSSSPKNGIGDVCDQSQLCLIHFLCPASVPGPIETLEYVNLGELIPNTTSCYTNDRDCDGWTDWHGYKCPDENGNLYNVIVKACDNCPPNPGASPGTVFPETYDCFNGPESGSICPTNDKCCNPKKTQICAPNKSLQTSYNFKWPSLISSAYASTPGPLPPVPPNFNLIKPGTVTVLINKTVLAKILQEDGCETCKPDLPDGKYSDKCMQFNGGDANANGIPDLCEEYPEIPTIGECYQDVGRNGHSAFGIGTNEDAPAKYVTDLNDRINKVICDGMTKEGKKCEPSNIHADIFVGEGGYFHYWCIVQNTTAKSLAVWQIGGMPIDPKNYAKDNQRPSVPPKEIQIMQASGQTITVSRDDLLKNSATRIIAVSDISAGAEGILASTSAVDFTPSIVAEKKLRLTMPENNLFVQTSVSGGLEGVSASLGSQGDPLMKVWIKQISPDTAKVLGGTAALVEIEGFAGYDVGAWYHPDLTFGLLQDRGLDVNPVLICITNAVNQMIEDPQKDVSVKNVFETANANGCMTWDTAGWLSKSFVVGTANAGQDIIPLGVIPSSGEPGCSCTECVRR